VLASTIGCVSTFPAQGFDHGRGAAPLPDGGMRVQAGITGNAAPLALNGGVGGGGRMELQVLDDVAVSTDAMLGAQNVSGIGITAPVSGGIGAHWNPIGLEWLALRLRVGGGLDAPVEVSERAVAGKPGTADDLSVDPSFPATFAAAQAQVVLSSQLDSVETWIAPGVGVKQFFGERNAVPRWFVASDSQGYVDTVLAPSVAAGLNARMNEHMWFYATAHITPAIALGSDAEVLGGLATGGRVALSPSAGAQSGLALVF
jgi:hypothetical protein